MTLIISTSLWANDKFGLGAVIGGTTGVTSNYFVKNDKSIDAALSYNLGRTDRLEFYTTYLFHHPDSLYLNSSIPLNWYWGLGGMLSFHDHKNRDSDFNIGPRAAIGISYDTQNAPVEIFLQGSSTLYLIESTDIDLQGVLGARYYF